MTNDQQAGVAQPPKAPKSPSRREQVAALPFRRAPDLQVLLVSSLESRRWIVPIPSCGCSTWVREVGGF